MYAAQTMQDASYIITEERGKVVNVLVTPNHFLIEQNGKYAITLKPYLCYGQPSRL